MYFNKYVDKFLKSNKVNHVLGIVGLPRLVPLSGVTLVGGAPRSGTTWLAETLSVQIGAKMLDEPLHLSRYPYLKNEAGIGWRPSLDANDVNQSLKIHLEEALAGQLPGLYTFPSPHLIDQLKTYLTGNKLIVKTVRSGQLVSWLGEHFNHVRGLVYTLRHPCAVVASQLHYEHGEWRNRSTSSASVPFLERLPRCKADSIRVALEQVDTIEEVLAIQWCVDNYLAVEKGISPFRGTFTTYEELLLNPKSELERILGTLGYKEEGSEDVYDKPSHSASKDLHDPRKQLSKWRNKLNANQIDRILNAVDAFGIKVYTDSLTPHLDMIPQREKVKPDTRKSSTFTTHNS
jgi:hypothetical protein